MCVCVCVCVIEVNSRAKWYRKWKCPLFLVLSPQKNTSKEIWNMSNVPEHKTDRVGHQSNPNIRIATFHRCLPSLYWISCLWPRNSPPANYDSLRCSVLLYGREYLTKLKLSYIKCPVWDGYSSCCGTWSFATVIRGTSLIILHQTCTSTVIPASRKRRQKENRVSLRWDSASRPKRRLMKTYFWISLFMSYKNHSKLAYRI
jgi:hypothetical protein